MRSWVNKSITAMLLVCVLAGAGVAAAAAVTFTDETVAVDEDTRSVYAEIENVSNPDSGVNATARVVIYGNNTSGETELTNTTVAPTGDNETALVEQSVNTTTYDDYRVVVSSDQENTTAERVDVGTLQEVQGGSGAGGALDGVSNAQMLGGVVVILGIIGYMKRE